MTLRNFKIQSIFSKWLGRKARDLAAKGEIKIIETADFPEGSPIHEDGSTDYDPRKPLAFFAVFLDNQKAIKTWREVCNEYDRLFDA